MAERPFMQLYGSDLVGDTLHLSAEQIGAYMLLLIAMWNAGGSLPHDDTKLARIARLTPAKWQKISDDLIALFDVLDGTVSHKRQQKEIKKMNEKREKNAASGSLGGKAKALKDKGVGLANATETLQRKPGIVRATPEPYPERKKEEPSAPRKRASRLPPEWAPSDDDKAWLRSKWPGVLRGTVETELEKFRNYWLSKSGKDATKLDWSRTWQNWMMTARDRTGTSAGHSNQKPQSTGQIFADLARSMNDADNDPAHDGADQANEQYALPSPRRREG